MPPRVRKPAATGADRIPKPSQGWYRDPANPDVKYRRVTTILEQGVPKAGLTYWAADTVAECAMSNLPYLVSSTMSRIGRSEAYGWLKAAATRKKEERAEVGLAIHKVIECHILELEPPVYEDPEIAAHVEHFHRFLADYQVEFTASEMVVANDEQKYAGTLDYLLRSPMIVALLIQAGLLPEGADPNLDIMGDTKSGGSICWSNGDCVKLRPSAFKACPGFDHSVKGIYADGGLQMAGYRAANRVWLRNGETAPMPATHPVGIMLHLQADGYLVIPARCDETVYAAFCHAVRVAEWTSDTSKNVIGSPLTIAQKETP